MIASATFPGDRSLRLPLVSLANVLLGFAAVQLAAFLNAGVFEYPLDDVYIHLAMAEQIAAGGYGVNAGEFASAASSPLYPVLLAPLAGSEAQRFLPLGWNLAALAACGWLWGRILRQAGYGETAPGYALVVAALVPLLINLPGIAYTGMEHSLHTAASLALISGLLVLLDEERLSPLLLAGIVLGPAFRFEALGLSLLAAGVLVLRGRPLAGLALGLAALGVIAGFMAFLVSLGLDPLPSSVQAKLGTGETASLLGGILGNLRELAEHSNGIILFALLLAMLAVAALEPSARSGPRRWLLVVVGGALVAHMLVGKVGWMNRYENYILVSGLAGLFALAAPAGMAARLIALAPVLVAAAVYAPHFLRTYPYATRTIDRQQAQMARLAQEFGVGPVAVNDLGRVAWGNPDYVLDLWGLGSIEALEIRRAGPEPGWGGPLAERHGVDLAMIYDPWIGSATTPSWRRLGILGLDGPFRYSAMPEVAIYATSPEAADRLRVPLSQWAADLPEGAWFRPDTEAGQ